MVDLGSNRFKTFPKALVKNSPRLSALYLDNNRLSDCSQMHVLRRAVDLELVDLSENRLAVLERGCVDGLAPGVTVRLAGNPFQCSCETAAVARWLLAADAVRGPEVVDRDSVTCSGPSELSGTHLLRPGTSSSTLPGSWECRWRADAIVVVVILLSVTVLCLVLILARRRLALSRLCRTTSSVSGQNGFISSVTISNSCYGNGAASGPGGGGGGSAPGGGESTTRYSPLIEDDPPTSGTQQVLAGPATASGRDDTASVDASLRFLVVCNGGVQRKQLDTSGGDSAATPCGEIDNEALLSSHVTEMEESV